MSLTGDNISLNPMLNEKYDAIILNNIKTFLQGCVYCWCRNKKDEWFRIRDLIDLNTDGWKHTPIIELLNNYKGQGLSEEEATKKTFFDANWALKHVLFEDNREFETKKKRNNTRKYRWITATITTQIPEQD